MSFTKSDIFKKLEIIGVQDKKELDIGYTALLLANLDLPDKSPSNYRDVLASIGSDLAIASSGVENLSDQVAVLSNVLYKQHGFHGDKETYYDPKNANLMSVIDRRKGLPVALGIIAIHAGRSQGWEISGVNFPGHFLLRLKNSGKYVLIDPFEEMRLVVKEDLQKIFFRAHGQMMPEQFNVIQPMSDRNVLVRLQNNIKIQALNKGDKGRAIEILQSINLIAPFNVEFLSELAILEASGGHIKSAVVRLEKFIELNPNKTDVSKIMDLKEKLNRSLN